MKILRTHTCLKSVFWPKYFLVDWFIHLLFYAVCVCMLMCVFLFLCIHVCVPKNRYHLIALSLRQIRGLNLWLLFAWLVWKTTGTCDPVIFAWLGAEMIGLWRNTLFFTWLMGSELRFLASQAKRFSCRTISLASTLILSDAFMYMTNLQVPK